MSTSHDSSPTTPIATSTGPGASATGPGASPTGAGAPPAGGFAPAAPGYPPAAAGAPPVAPGASPVAAQAAPRKRGFRLAIWPLWGALASALAFAGTVAFDVRPAAELAAWERGEDYIVTPADMMGLDHVASRLGWTVGLIGVLALLIFLAYWRRNAEERFARSVGARLFTGGILATAATLMLGYGWKGALANYLGPEAGLYDEEGLFVYYMLTDFGAYLPGFGLVAAAIAIVWMAFAERTVSRILGGFTAVAALFILAMTFGTGVPGLPGVYGLMWLGIASLWLAVGRSRITEREDAALGAHSGRRRRGDWVSGAVRPRGTRTPRRAP